MISKIQVGTLVFYLKGEEEKPAASEKGVVDVEAKEKPKG